MPSALFGHPMPPHAHVISLRPALAPIATALLLLFLSALSLPSQSSAAYLFRAAIVVPIVLISYDILLNPVYSFGSPFRDNAFPSLAFLCVYRAIDLAFLNLWDHSPASHWIVPVDPHDSFHPSDQHPDMPPRPSQSPQTTRVFNSNTTKWRTLPHPPLFSFDRLLFTLDHLTLMRPGTPWIFPWKIRALEWSRPALESNRPHFGQPEWPFLLAIVQQAAHKACHIYVRKLDLRSHQTLWDQPLLTQCALTFALGGIVGFSSALEEAIVFPILIHFKILPPTALASSSKRAILSSGLVDLWGKRWHHLWRRCFIRLARLVPGATRNVLIHTLATFWISALMHCVLIARLYPKPKLLNPWTLLPIFYEPGIYIFFLCQGLGLIVERILISWIERKGRSLNDSSIEMRLVKFLNWVWLYFVLIGSGRYVTNTLVVKGMMAKSEWDAIEFLTVIKMLVGLIGF